MNERYPDGYSYLYDTPDTVIRLWSVLKRMLLCQVVQC